MHFLLFLPGKSGTNLDHLHEAGLGWLLQPGDDDPVLTDLRGTGPGGQFGQIVSWLKGDMRYEPDRQTWKPAAADPAAALPAGRYWIGWDHEQPPTADELLRAKPIAGPVLALNGQAWIVPSALKVPQRMTLNGEGRFEPIVMDRYRDFVERSKWALDCCLRDLEVDGTLPLEEAAEYAIRALQWNYRLPRELASDMGILEVANLFGVLMHTTDVTRIRAVAESLKNGEAPQTPSG